jgi:methylenetetrahydrofolate dehydrogenase (NADP+)/methenyltetrahydrofolate cyclohydrolase
LILSGKEVANKIREEVKNECLNFIKESSHTPCLAVVLVGDDPASSTYVASKGKVCDEIGFKHKDVLLDKDISEKELINKIEELNTDDSVDGILVQLPLPKHLSERKVIGSIVSDKDVDGLHLNNLGSLITEENNFVPCTPKGILKILDYYNIQTTGKNVVVVGRSNIVGKPIAALLMQKGKDATVTVCHSKTKDLEKVTKTADILIAAIGRANFITKEMVKPEAVVIDVGINRVQDSSRKSGYRIVGDVDYENVVSYVDAITPVPGGVGPMTIASLMENTLIAARKHYDKRRTAR